MAVIRKKHKVWTVLLLALYLVLLFYFLFFSESMGRTGQTSYESNLVPLAEIRRFAALLRLPRYRTAAILNLGGNLIAFMPFAVLLSVLVHPRERCFGIVLASFVLSLCVETTQLLGRLGCFDVDDLILNTLGGFLGFWLYRLGRSIVTARQRKKPAARKSRGRAKKNQTKQKQTKQNQTNRSRRNRFDGTAKKAGGSAGSAKQTKGRG